MYKNNHNRSIWQYHCLHSPLDDALRPTSWPTGWEKQIYIVLHFNRTFDGNQNADVAQDEIEFDPLVLR